MASAADAILLYRRAGRMPDMGVEFAAKRNTNAYVQRRTSLSRQGLFLSKHVNICYLGFPKSNRLPLFDGLQSPVKAPLSLAFYSRQPDLSEDQVVQAL